MANRFAKYLNGDDSAPAAAASPAQPASANRFAKYLTPDDASTPASDDDVGVAGQGAIGVVTAIPNAIAGISDLGEMAGHAIIKGENPFTSSYVPRSGAAIRKAESMDKIPEAQGEGEKMARAAGDFLGTTVATAGLGSEASLGKLAWTGAKAAPVGAASQYATDSVTEPYKPYVGIGTALLGGAGIEAAEAGVKGAAKVIAPAVTQAGKEELAGKILWAGSKDPKAAVHTIETAPREIVPGSQPTTFQLTGDPGLGKMERGMGVTHSDEFIERREQQNAARLDHLTDVQAEGHPQNLSDFVTSQADDLEQQHNALHDQAQTAAQTKAEGLGGGDAAVLGEQARTAIQTRLDSVKERLRSLWKAVDPDGTLHTVTAPIKSAVENIYGKMGPEAQINMEPVEAKLADVINGYGSTLPFQRLIDLRSAVSKAMRDVRSPLNQPNETAYARLTQLRGSVEKAISDSVTQKAAGEQSAVAAGIMQPADTLGSRLAKEIETWRNDRAALADTGESAGSVARRGPSAVSGASGAESSAGKGLGNNQGGPDLSGPPLIDQGAADRLKTATAATADKKQTFGAKPISNILQRPGNTMEYDMGAGKVTSSIWQAGNKGGDSVKATLKAAGNHPDAVEAVKNMAAQSLRDHAKGDITQKALDAWKTKHASALDALENAAPGTKLKFQSAATAGEHLATVAAERKAAIDGYQKSVAGKLIGADPADVPGKIGAIFKAKDSVAQMKALVAEASKDPDALQGLRKAIVEHMESTLVSRQELGTSGRPTLSAHAFQKFVHQNKAALLVAFEPEQVRMMDAIAQDLGRGNRSVSGSKLPGGSNTAQDTAAAAKMSGEESPGSWLKYLVADGIGEHIAEFLTGTPLIGRLAVGAIAVKKGLQSAGIKNAHELVKQAMLDPDLARTLMLKAAPGTALTLKAKLLKMGTTTLKKMGPLAVAGAQNTQ